MNAALYAVYGNQPTAEQIRASLIAAGIARRAIELLTLPVAEATMHAGSFADSDTHDHDAARDHAGSFADSGTHDHDAARDHVGSFATHLHADDIVRKLVAAGVAAADAQAQVGTMAPGATLVLARPSATQLAAAEAILRAGA
jgi:ABC-type Zn2+ transport system substrate-binding protein/surface adhesin